MFHTKRFGLVASKQEYQMLCRAERHMKEVKHRESAKRQHQRHQTLSKQSQR